MLVIEVIEVSIIAVGVGTIGRGSKLLFDMFENKDRAELALGTEWLPCERLAVVFASIRECELAVAFADTLGLALADTIVDVEVGTLLTGRLSALMMSAAFK